MTADIGDAEEISEHCRKQGNDFYRAKRFHRAIEAYSAALNAKVSAVVLSNRAQAYLAIKYYEAALTDASEAIRLDSALVKAYFRRANALRFLGLYSKARADYKKVIELDPSNSEAKKQLDIILTSCDRPLIPIQYFEKNIYVRCVASPRVVPVAPVEMPTASSSVSEETLCGTDLTGSSGLGAEDEHLPSPATNAMEFSVAFSSLQHDPHRCLEYFITLSTSSFPAVFKAGVEPDVVETLISGLATVTVHDPAVLERLALLIDAPRFELCLALLSDQQKQQVHSYLKKFSPANNVQPLINKISSAFES